MKFMCTATTTADGRWRLQHTGREVGRVEVTAASRQEAVEKMKGEIRYRLELCPCTGQTYQHIAIELVQQPAAGQARP